MDFSTPIENIPRVGPVMRKRLRTLGIKTVLDLLFYFPSRYEDFSNLIPISDVKINEVCTVQGRILEIKTTRTWKRKMFITEAIIEDKTGAIKSTWFGQPYLSKILKKDDPVFISGKVVVGNNEAYLSNPIYEKTYSQADDIETINSNKLTHTGRIIPIYSEAKGLSSRWLRSNLKFILASSNGKLPETLPEKIIAEQKLLDINRALWEIHFPSSFEKVGKAKERFSFEELFYIELFVLRERAKLNKEKAHSIPFNLDLIKELVSLLPFRLTDGQRKSAYQILKDIEKSRPMNRLLQGDVGSGKTVVAAIAALNAIKAGRQAAFMAPTEILAKQHFQEIAKLLGNFNLNIGLLTGKQDQFRSKKLKNDIVEISRKKLLEKTLKAEIDILIGTHALIQDKVKFGKLGLVILDEQHRFGVEQRAKLVRGSKLIPHLLSMTATPIPRTLALTIYGDLDLSLIDELPKGRKKIITEVVEPEDRTKTYGFIKREVENGRQIFVICPRIEKPDAEKEYLSGWSEAKAVKEEYEKLSKTIFPALKVGILHGKMTSKEKEKTMLDFKNKKIQILVSTSVVEVGIDVPNATVMMIEGAERFGLAQLHQFRGRVGRGEYQSYCLLFTDSSSQKTKQRLKALITCENGFQLAEKDLEIRGPGDFSGTRQWGIPDLMMDSLKDIRLVEKTREIAKEILIEDPYLKKYPILQAKISRFRESIHME
ncbi:MAG: ATP-dependent DNA helicase RecG [Candidatus Nealsonbacteria bacterium RIFCSPHIGHO2_01_FULL_38_55]|uniref:ATP-dependent DNA helicase RecG n=1 Tax=Candidatus Nealsonbacteria bacterium RIFCSPHIGHO2_01_FULL_38_55 TaxID=1801664 RepID=A0A1G2E3C6_9BACT|nr:MAG: ATP-dependent DNA helicase RecG [Parcubacteria group bacterium GW2011_GWA2_38_27]OGZ20354.1 MAG: ATP-dependent DNA helicase RecG [Candidatus Nealsonbacteria bacterium RIFCSPHIGHO2_01_FULL_38_55]OGZ21243.1 MAG: ATP-dependent DNA helicase RecG [Candidatus Nealsonbacteria bacterium RIFCSPHIGHO2_02_FULL_38_75]OGZ22435.1 MAG: ATP-dependent DNA helicase RecG [Candidatus Nealsonbacteria bacterium RIFCSPLOWO2_01_FULL_38_120]OGZ23252.1 MAG: ATP-dependent DNA helicase RecG [Candidatus Nealsonbact